MRPERPSQSSWIVASQLTAVAWEFLGSIMAGALLGWLADRQFRTAPWGLIGCTLFGTSTGLYRMIVVLKRFERRRRDE
jgi:F0F1-type ATP synthase assembly protein I